MRYFGTAPWPDGGARWSHATHVADLAAFIRGLNAGPVVLVGQSYGSQISAIVAANHPELVRAMFLNEPPIGTAMTSATDRAAVAEDTKGLSAVRDAVNAGNNDEAARRFFDFVNGKPGAFDQLTPAARAVHLDNARTIPVQFKGPPPVQLTCEQLGTLKIPVTITKGELTRTWFRILAENTQRCIPAAQLLTIKGAWHGAPRSEPAAFNEALLAFLSRV
jgi:pimeloyl-ACP methyl ester carboxylesterase